MFQDEICREEITLFWSTGGDSGGSQYTARNKKLIKNDQECYTTIIHNLDLSSIPCLTHVLSKFLGLGIVLGGAIVKVPQILKIVQGRSAKGLSLTSYLLDTAGLMITVAYNLRMRYTWSSYGENVFLLAQNVR